MINTNTYLNVPYAQKDEAKALGARWDRTQRKWYVPAGLAPEAFSRWLPVQTVMDEEPAEYKVQQPVKDNAEGVALSQLLNQVQIAVTQAFQGGVWVQVEVIDARINNGHVYLELSERSADGRVVASARGIIWASVAQRILPAFEAKTGVAMAAGIKLLLRATPNFHVQYGLSLQIDAINADYTLGDLEATKRDIRLRLTAEGLFDANKQLAAPWDFNRVLVVAPQSAAGLGDFQAEAHRLQQVGLCEFIYVHSRFQGGGAALEITAALEKTLLGLPEQATYFDAVVVIRGGGAVNDLAWLNQYELVKALCSLPIPVFTGIGHERDSTSLDEVAHTSFDTPSKVIAGIEQHIIYRASEAKRSYEELVQRAKHLLWEQKKRAEQNMITVQDQAQRHIQQATQLSTALFREIMGQGPEKTLARGFALLSKNNQIISCADDLHVGDTVDIRFNRSQLRAQITELHKDKE